jgi:MFS family permease
LFMAMSLSMLAFSSFIGVAMDRFGMKPPLVNGPLLVALALVLMSIASRLADLIPAVIVLGAGGAALNAATNTLVADLHEDPGRKGAALNILGVFCGIGALFLPFCVGALLRSLWRSSPPRSAIRPRNRRTVCRSPRWCGFFGRPSSC